MSKRAGNKSKSSKGKQVSSSKPGTRKSKPSPQSPSNKSPQPGNSKPARQKRTYRFRDLPIPPQSTLAEYLLYLAENPEAADSLLRPGEMWALDFWGNKSYVPLESASLFRTYMERYGDLVKKLASRFDLEGLMRGIRILKVGKPMTEPGDVAEEKTIQDYAAKRQREREKLARENAETEAAARAAFLPTAKPSDRIRKTDILKAAIEKVGEFQKALDSTVKKFAKLEKQARKAAKSAKKAASKKPAGPTAAETKLMREVEKLRKQVAQLSKAKPVKKAAKPVKPVKKAAPKKQAKPKAKPAKKAAKKAAPKKRGKK